ncbi:bleomycin resistance protein [Priestia koreensis]|uniref:bleomycin resistance protein n=1 Tax=Priestia koreensis TaxID=284581 RepID=UPI001F570544|nr:VOC family protein [Priestia koreensis]MCM3006141.1 VOC family protein [Priestia koreensis]
MNWKGTAIMKFNTLIPELSVSNLHVSKEFYLGVIGFELEYERKEDRFAFISLNGAQMMIEERNGHWETGELVHPYGRGINFQIAVTNIEALFSRIQKHNVPLFRDMMVNTYSGYTQKEFILQDPDGYLLRFSENC